MKITCRNLFCDADDIEINDTYENFDKYKDMVCPVCGYIGMMPESHVLRTKTIVEQIWFFSDKVLFRDLLKKVNFEKLPRNMVLQSLVSKEGR